MSTLSNDMQKHNSSLGPHGESVGQELGASRSSTIKDFMPRSSIGVESALSKSNSQVRFTKQMIKDRERFLGVSSRPRAGGRFRDLPGSKNTGNTSLE